ncbi:DNA-binding protein Ewg isoform X1 [Contarinia nasturtii]|uniref:DNA-binding protein Ewg isoform X1 n=1 Tax=Contarinia nasturtii TaxID=265458 RepID=UPI0012D4A323|nr:DNA-binding protein Ewg isoform X1 [Contarinia nasturtii]
MNQATYIGTETIEMIEDDQIDGMTDDDDDEGPSSPESAYDGDLMHDDEVTAQLAAAGPVGVAAAAAIASAKKRKRPHSFETNPSIRKRQQNRLLRKLRQTIYEFATRVGQQAVVLVATPGKPNTSYKVFGAKPLEDVVRNLKSIVMEELESALAQQAPPPVQEDPSLFELPPLIIDGIPTPVEKMTQAQLRAFIPLMLKYSTGRGKPGWGRESTRPPWWPKELPWANVRMDARTEDEKQKISWTHALRKIVINCYKFHGREDLLPAFSEEDEKANQLATLNSSVASSHVGVLKVHNSGVTTSSANNVSNTITKQIHIQTQPTTQTITNAQIIDSMSISDVDYTQGLLHSIQNADGTVSIIQVDPSNQIITLPDGTTAQVQGIATLSQGDGGTVQTVQSIDTSHENMTVDLTEATLGQDGQIIITGEDGQGYPVSVSGMITLPVSSSVYQSMVANIQQIHTNGDGTLCITPMQVQKSGHQHLINHINSTSIGGSLIGSANNCSVSPCISSVNSSSFSNINSGGNTSILANCQPNSGNPFVNNTSELSSNMNCNNPNNTMNNTNNNLLELCRVLSQTTNNVNNCHSTVPFNNNLSANFANSTDRKSMKTNKKLINRNQYQNTTPTTATTTTTSFDTSMSSFSTETNGNNFIEQNIDLKSDTNNNNHNNENNGNDNHDLKCAQILVSTVIDDSTKLIKLNNESVGENDTPSIKMECEIDVA